MITLIGFLAALANAISLVPEIKKAIQTHHLRDIAWGMLFFLSCSSFMWLLYGVHIVDYPIIVSDGINLVLAIFLITLKARYSKGYKPLIAKKMVKVGSTTSK